MATARQQLAVASQREEAVDVFHVAVRKYGIDADSPWWRKAFFRGVYLPFVRFAFNRFGIPAPAAILADGRFEWLEGIGVASDEASARAMCKGEFYRVARLPFNCALGEKSVQYKGHVYPKSVVPDRYRRRTFPPAQTPVVDTKTVSRWIAQVDRIQETIDATVL